MGVRDAQRSCIVIQYFPQACQFLHIERMRIDIII